jgi:pantoate--beta-alanine ligase
VITNDFSVATTVADCRARCEAARRASETVVLVPTMGALHLGHQRLIETASDHGTFVVVSIFVNPTQFGPNEDFAKYPRPLEADLELCRAAGARLAFAPSVEQMYAPGERTRVRVDGLTRELCGRSRPAHFDGVTTVVAKLFSIVAPQVALFGRKDYQQLRVIQKMVSDLLLPVTVVGCPTVREPDGLAMSSRNRYLSEEERKAALAIPDGLSRAVRAYRTGERSASALLRIVEGALSRAGLRPDYVTLADADLLEPVATDGRVPNRVLLALAAFCGTTRLIDNVVLGEDPPPLAEDVS